MSEPRSDGVSQCSPNSSDRDFFKAYWAAELTAALDVQNEAISHQTRRSHLGPLAATLALSVAVAGGGTYMLNETSSASTQAQPAATANAFPNKTTHMRPTGHNNPTSCTSESTSGTPIVDIGCAKRAVRRHPTAAVRRDLGAVVTVTVNNYWSETGTGLKIGPGEIYTAGHITDFLHGRCIAGSESVVDVPVGNNKRGVSVRVKSLKDGYHSERVESSDNTDLAGVFVGGPQLQAFNAMPTVPTESNAQKWLKPGTVLNVLSNGPDRGSGSQQDATSLVASQRVTNDMNVIYLGADANDADDGIVDVVGSATGGLGAFLEGTSGSGVVVPASGVDIADAVETFIRGNNEPQEISGTDFLGKYGIEVRTGDGQMVPKFNMGIIQFIPSTLSQRQIDCHQ
jgi:hypothetical protein